MRFTTQELFQVIKYGISGVVGGVLQVSFLYIFVDRLGLWYLYGVVSAYLADSSSFRSDRPSGNLVVEI